MPPREGPPLRPRNTDSPTLAFAGAGRITALHGLAAKALGLTVSHVASRRIDNANRRASELGAVACAYEDLPAGADLVVVASPPAQHAAHALRALEGGAGALVEKPLCVTLAEADLLVDAEARCGRPLIYGENLAFAPVVRQALDEIGELGPLQHLEARAVQARPDWGDFLSAAWGGGALFDLGAHPIALCLLAAGAARPIQVSASLEAGADHDVDEWAEVRMRFETGLEARVVASWRDPDGAWDLQAASQTGVVRLELLPTLSLERNGDALAAPPARTSAELALLDQLGYVTELEVAADLVSGADGDVKPGGGHPGAEFGRTVLEVICAAYRSAGEGGAPQALPFKGARDRTPLDWWRRPDR